MRAAKIFVRLRRSNMLVLDAFAGWRGSNGRDVSFHGHRGDTHLFLTPAETVDVHVTARNPRG